MKSILRSFEPAADCAEGETCVRPAAMRDRVPAVSIGLALLGWLGVGLASATAAAVQYAGHAGAHNLYVLNENGHLFRWGEPRYGEQTGSRASVVIPYYDTVLAVPPSPSGARWAQAAGHDANELFLDESGRAFASQVNLARAAQLFEIVHPDTARKWRHVANAGQKGTLVDDTGQLYELQLGNMFNWLIGHPATPLPVPNTWLTFVGRPGTYEAVIEAETRPGFDLVRTANGELYGRGYSHWGIAGSIPVPGGVWHRVERPTGVSWWTSFKVSSIAAIALGDNGEAYYWGLRIPGSLAAAPSADPKIPARIDRPTGVSRWRSVGAVGSLALLVSEAGELFAFGVETSELMAPFPGGPSPLTVATPAIHPLLQGAFDSVLCGADYVIARGSDGTDVRWGVFMRLDNGGQPGGLAASPLALPERITTLPQRLAPGARMLAPASFNRVPVGEPITLSAEVFPLDGSLAFTRFIVNQNMLPGVPPVSGHQATLSWSAATPGEHTVKVLATDTAGRTNVSAEVPFSTRHAVRWTLSTNRISEVAGDGLGTSAEIEITRTELPYPNYHPFSFRFRIAPLPLLDKDFSLTGATLHDDGSAQWEVLFAAGQKTATVRITALADPFNEPTLNVHVEPSYDWATSQDYIHPAQPLNLDIVDAAPTGGPSSVFIVDLPETRYSFVGDTVPISVSVPKSLVELPVVQLYLTPDVYFFPELHSIQDLSERWVYHFTARNLPVGLSTLTARVRDGTGYGYNRYQDSAPLLVRVWESTGLPRVRVVAAEYAVNEHDAPVLSLSVMREGSLNAPVDVGLDIRGTALSGSDYDALPANVVVPAGTGFTQVSLRILDDSRAELDESIQVSARQVPCEQLEGCVVADRNSVFRLTILDDDRTEPEPGGAEVIASPFSDVSYLRTASGQGYAWGDNRAGQLGLGGLPPELAGAVPWPRRMGGLAAGERWSGLLVGPAQTFGTTTPGGLFAWGAGFPGHNLTFNLPTPRPVISLPPGAEPFYVWDGSLITRLGSGQLQAYRMTSYAPHQMLASGEPGMAALRVTPQLRVLGDDGYFREHTDWQGLYADRYPLAPGAGYWRDAASSRELLVALDELGGLYRIEGGAIQFDPALGRTRRYYTTEALPALPANRPVARLLGNDRGILALATDGAAFALRRGTNGEPPVASELIAFPDGVTRWTSLAAGRNHFLAVGDDGRVYAWGENSLGQLGDGTTDPADGPRALPVFADVNDPAVEFPTLSLDRPPVANFHGMEAEYQLGGPETIRASARAYDPDGVIELLEFLINGDVAATAEFDYELMAFVADVFMPHPGEHVLTVRAWDDAGLSGESGEIPVYVDDPGRYPVVKVWNDPSGTAEGYGFPGYFIISRQGIADVPLTVYFDIHGTATEGTDYPGLPRSVVIPAGAAEVRIPVIARPDFLDEDTEEVNLTILNPGCNPDTAPAGSGCYRIGEPATAPVFILDYLRPGDAFLPFVSLHLLNSPIIREGMTHVAVIEARRHGVLVEDLPVYYELGGTAENGVDYQHLSGVVVIPAGADHARFSITAIEDTITEPFERIILTVSDSGCGGAAGSADGCYLSDSDNSLVVYVGERVIPPPLPNSVPRPVLFDNIIRFPGEGTLLSVVSDAGATFVLEATADMVNWEQLGQLTSGNGRVEFFDVDAVGTGSRFYRLAPPPDP